MSIDYIDGFVLRRRSRVARGIELGPASEPQDTSEQRSNTSLAGIYPRPILSLRKLTVFYPRDMPLRLVDFSLAPLRVGSVSRCPARWLRTH